MFNAYFFQRPPLPGAGSGRERAHLVALAAVRAEAAPQAGPQLQPPGADRRGGGGRVRSTGGAKCVGQRTDRPARRPHPVLPAAPAPVRLLQQAHL